MKEEKKIRTGVTGSGFEFEVEEAALDDWELLESLVELEKGSRTGYIGAANGLLGKKGAAALKEHCRGKDGRVPITAVAKELNEIFELIAKKS